MVIKLTAIVLGVVLAIYGGMLATQEIALFSALDIARQARKRTIRADAVQLAGAIRQLDQTQAERHDLILSKLQLELALWSKISVGNGSPAPSADSQARIARFAMQVGASAPLNGQAWCLLAQLTAKQKGWGKEVERFLLRCYKTAPKELWQVERRLHLAMALWPLLSTELKESATDDMVMIVRARDTTQWPARVLSYAAGVVAPQNANMIREIIATYRPALLAGFDRQVLAHRRRAAAAKAR